MFYVVSYDIPDNTRRARLARVLKNYGERVQLSVFECILDRRLHERMARRIAKTIEEDEDRVRIYRLCGECVEAVQILGQGVLTEDPDVYII